MHTKRAFGLISIEIMMMGTAAVLGFAAGFDDIAEIKTVAASNAAALNISFSQVHSNYFVVATETNNNIVKICTTDRLETGTNFIFCYTGNPQKLILVELRNCQTNGMDYRYHWNGVLSSYLEYHAGVPDGVYMKFYTNGQVQAFGNISNSYFIGEGYRFDMSGMVIEAVTSSIPQEFTYKKDPPQ